MFSIIAGIIGCTILLIVFLALPFVWLEQLMAPASEEIDR